MVPLLKYRLLPSTCSIPVAVGATVANGCFDVPVQIKTRFAEGFDQKTFGMQELRFALFCIWLIDRVRVVVQVAAEDFVAEAHILACVQDVSMPHVIDVLCGEKVLSMMFQMEHQEGFVLGFDACASFFSPAFDRLQAFFYASQIEQLDFLSSLFQFLCGRNDPQGC